jgi:hypothetical protein
MNYFSIKNTVYGIAAICNWSSKLYTSKYSAVNLLPKNSCALYDFPIGQNPTQLKHMYPESPVIFEILSLLNYFRTSMEFSQYMLQHYTINSIKDNCMWMKLANKIISLLFRQLNYISRCYLYIMNTILHQLQKKGTNSVLTKCASQKQQPCFSCSAYPWWLFPNIKFSLLKQPHSLRPVWSSYIYCLHTRLRCKR